MSTLENINYLFGSCICIVARSNAQAFDLQQFWLVTCDATVLVVNREFSWIFAMDHDERLMIFFCKI